MKQTEPQNELEPNTSAESLPTLSPREILKDYLLLLLGSGVIVFLDTWTKDLVDRNLAIGEAWLPEKMYGLQHYFRIIHLQNKGTAFGLFRDETQINLVITFIAIIASLSIIFIFPRIEKKERTLRIALILQLAGAVGNLISRLRYGYVLDFISVGTFPVFNVADSSITIGLVVLILGMIVQEIKERQKPSQHEPDDLTEHL